MLIREVTEPRKEQLDEGLPLLLRIFKWLKPKPGKPKPKPIRPRPGGGGWLTLGWFAWTLITALIPVAGMGLQLAISAVSGIISKLVDNNTVEEGEIEAELKAAGVPEEDMPVLVKQIQDSIDNSEVVDTLKDRDRDPSKEELERDLEELYKNFDEKDFEELAQVV